MQTFEYRAAGVDGAIVEGRQLASNELALDRELESRALTLIRARAVRDRGPVRARAALGRPIRPPSILAGTSGTLRMLLPLCEAAARRRCPAPKRGGRWR